MKYLSLEENCFPVAFECYLTLFISIAAIINWLVIKQLFTLENCVEGVNNTYLSSFNLSRSILGRKKFINLAAELK